MDKAALRKYAVQARKDLIQQVKQRARAFGITQEGFQPIDQLSDALIVNGQVMGEVERKQYLHLKNRIQLESYDTVMDEAAYTWFNRFIALRYMEVNNFLPIHMRILSSETPSKKEPDALTHILEIADELGMNKERIYSLQDQNKREDLYNYLLVQQSNKLGEIIPNVFTHISDDLALLLPINLLNENSPIGQLISMIPEDNWENIEVVGWLYQFYISEQKDEVFAGLKKNKKIGKQEIAPATQLFTPRWIVEYMVDNSLGRLWLESHPDETIQQSLRYYLEDAEQTPDVEQQLNELKDPHLDVESIKFLDPSCGSGHILVYAFEVLHKLYLSRGYAEREIPSLILENNLYGLDIDKRAAQLATFAVVMKAREYDRRLFNREYTVHVHSIEESNGMSPEFLHHFAKGNEELQNQTAQLIETFDDAKLYGSLIQVPEINTELIKKQMEHIREQGNLDIFTTAMVEYDFPMLEDILSQHDVLKEQYEVVVTNPPYANKYNNELKKFVNEHYKDVSKDLFSIFIKRNLDFCKPSGYSAYMTPMVWMFIKSYEKLRRYVINEKHIDSLVHLEYSAFEEATVPLCTFVLKNEENENKGTYVRLAEFRGGMKVQEKKYLDAVNKKDVSYTYHKTQENFSKIPGSPIAYWLSKIFLNLFNFPKVDDFFVSGGRTKTHNNEKYVRYFWEIVPTIKWTSYDNGGGYNKFYGNRNYVVNTSKEALAFYDKNGGLPNNNFLNREGITWNLITSNVNGFRIKDQNSMYSSASPTLFEKNDAYDMSLYSLLGFLNTKISKYLLKVINPTLNTTVGDVLKLPFKTIGKEAEKAKSCVDITQDDWDSFETSWDFGEHPFLTYHSSSSIEDSFDEWERIAEERFYQLKENEEELNRIFIDLYGLQEELTPDVEEKDVTVRQADRVRDIKSFLSYLVGIIFGRYSLDKKGLAYVGGDWDPTQYQSYKPDQTNILPITEEAIFEDDIVTKVEELVALIYGKESLEENLLFIAESLTKKNNESSRERIRRYFRNEFYKDHLQIYKKRPIYWQFSSGLRGAFKGLIYLHRYDKDTLARLRTEYILKESQILDNLVSLDQHTMEDPSVSASERTKSQKRIEGYVKDKEEIAKYSEALDILAKQQIELDLDDGVKVNYEKFQEIEIVNVENNKKMKMNLLEKI